MSSKPTQQSPKEVLYGKVRDLNRQSAETGTIPDAGVVDGLERLSRLITIEEQTKPVRSIRAWHTVALAAAVLFGLSLLLIEKKQVEVELEIVTTYVKLVTATSLDPRLAIPVHRVSLSGIGRAYVPSPNEGESYRTFSDKTLLILETPGAQLQLDTPLLSASSAIDLTALGSSTYRVGLCSRDALTGRVFGNGVVDVLTPIGPKLEVRLGTDSAIEFWSRPNEELKMNNKGCDATWPVDRVDANFVSAAKNIEFVSSIPISFLSFEQPSVETIGTDLFPRASSAIKSGTLIVHSLKGQTYDLKGHQRLSFAQIRGTIQNLRLEPEQIRLSFIGQVGGMVTGSEDNTRSLMPSYLQWWLAQDRMTILWTTFISAFGLIFGAVKWWLGSR
jgi:hypothetical protein